MQKKIHGVITNRNIPGRVANIRSKKNIITNKKIRLDKLIRTSRPKILIKRTLGGLGDVLMSTPIMKHLKRIMPHCEITYMTDLKYSWGGLGEIIKHNPYVDHLLENGKAIESEYDYSVDITSTGLDREKSGSIPPNRIDMFAEEVGIDVSSDPQPDYIVTKSEKIKATKYLKDKFSITKKNRDNYKIIIIQTRSNDARRTWPENHVKKLSKILAEDKNNIILLMDWGSSVDRWKSEDNIYAIKDLPFIETAALMEKCDLVICPDSSLLHLAGALNKKTVSIFGPIPPESRINHYPNTIAVYNKLNCSFCWYSPRCSNFNLDKMYCLSSVTPEMVAEAAKKHMGEPMKTYQNIKYGKDTTLRGQDNIILVKRSCGGLGDILMAGPALKALKLKFPDKEIHLAIPKQYIPLMKELDFISKVIDVKQPINNNRYYMLIDISTPCAKYESARIAMNKKVEKSRIEIFAEALGARNLLESYTPYYNVTEKEKEWAQTFLDSQKSIDKNKPILAVQLKSAEIYRDYPESSYKELLSLLTKDFNVLIMNAEQNEIYPNIIDICNFEIREWAAILSLCDGMLSVDTGPLHVAAALNIPTIALFGPIDYQARCKGYKNTLVLKSNQECIPCWRNANIACKQTGMVKSYSKCLSSIPPRVIVKNLLNKLKK